MLGTLDDQRKLRNLRRDPRVAVRRPSPRWSTSGACANTSSSTGRRASPRAAQRTCSSNIAWTYLGPDVVFPGMPDPPPGFVTHVRVERVSGIGPWGP